MKLAQVCREQTGDTTVHTPKSQCTARLLRGTTFAFCARHFTVKPGSYWRACVAVRLPSVSSHRAQTNSLQQQRNALLGAAAAASRRGRQTGSEVLPWHHRIRLLLSSCVWLRLRWHGTLQVPSPDLMRLWKEGKHLFLSPLRSKKTFLRSFSVSWATMDRQVHSWINQRQGKEMPLRSIRPPRTRKTEISQRHMTVWKRTGTWRKITVISVAMYE